MRTIALVVAAVIAILSSVYGECRTASDDAPGRELRSEKSIAGKARVFYEWCMLLRSPSRFSLCCPRARFPPSGLSQTASRLHH